MILESDEDLSTSNACRSLVNFSTVTRLRIHALKNVRHSSVDRPRAIRFRAWDNCKVLKYRIGWLVAKDVVPEPATVHPLACQSSANLRTHQTPSSSLSSRYPIRCAKRVYPGHALRTRTGRFSEIPVPIRFHLRLLSPNRPAKRAYPSHALAPLNR